MIGHINRQLRLTLHVQTLAEEEAMIGVNTYLNLELHIEGRPVIFKTVVAHLGTILMEIKQLVIATPPIGGGPEMVFPPFPDYQYWYVPTILNPHGNVPGMA
jgi:hypothetical protein